MLQLIRINIICFTKYPRAVVAFTHFYDYQKINLYNSNYDCHSEATSRSASTMLSLSSLLLPDLAQPLSISNIRFPCSYPSYSESFGRQHDLNRHLKHQVVLKDFDCSVRGCSCKGNDGFMTMNKVKDHVKARHDLRIYQIFASSARCGCGLSLGLVLKLKE